MKRTRAKRIAFFNHKGGVGKTVLTANVAAALAEQGKKVLLVDSDPQCNLSAFVLDDISLDKLLDESDSPEGKTIWSAVKPLYESEGPIKAVTPLQVYGSDLFLIPGDVRLSDFEVELSEYWAACFQRRVKGFKGMYALSEMIDLCQNRKSVDYVFYDTGPNIGPLNRTILLDCDYFIVPGSCDLFSVRALKTLGRSLSTWIKLWQTITPIAPDGVKLLKGKPKYLGYVPQGFRRYREVVASSHQRYLASFERHLLPDLIAPLHQIDKNLAEENVTRSKLGEIQNYSALVQGAQAQGVPLWRVDDGKAYLSAEAKEDFYEIANAILERTEADEL